VSSSLIIGAIWVIAATVTALLPMRLQFPPGFTLLALAPFVIGFIGYEHGPWLALAGFAGFVSMFRRPLFYYIRKWSGHDVPTSPKPSDRT